MFLPLGDEPNPRGIPWVTYSLIAINVGVYVFVSFPLSLIRPDMNDPLLLEYLRVILEMFPAGQISAPYLLEQVSAYDLFVFSHGFRPVDPIPVSLITSMFLHSGFVHLAGNMLFLWIYGDNVEHRLGSSWFLVGYVTTGVIATIFHTAFALDSPLPLVGASGAISGVLGFYFLWFPHNRVRLLVVLFPFFMNVITLPARIVLGFYLVFSNIMPFLVSQGMPGGGVAYGAHIGGFLGGLGWAWWLGRREVTVRPKEYRDHHRTVLPSEAEVVTELVSQKSFAEAAPAYFRLTSEKSRRLLKPEDSIAFGSWLAADGHSAAALTVFQRHLRDYPLGPMAAKAHLGAGLVQLRSLAQPSASYQHFVEVFDHDPEPETLKAAKECLREIGERQKFKVH